MKKRCIMALVAVLIIMICLPVAVLAEFLDKSADPPPVVSSGSFICKSWIGTTMDSFSVVGGDLTEAKWTTTQGLVIYNLTGTFDPGEAVSLKVTGSQGDLSKSNVTLKDNSINIRILYYDKSGKALASSAEYKPVASKSPTLSHALAGTIPPDAVRIEMHGSFTCKWYSPYTSASETVGVSVKLKLKEKSEQVAPLPVTTESESEASQPLPTSDPAPVIHIVDDPVRNNQGEEATAVKTAAIIGIAATIAALGAAGAMGAAGSSAAASTAAQQAMEEAARQKTGDFQMVVYKNFGETVEFDKPGQEVYARIESSDIATGMWQYDVAKSMAISIGLSPANGLSHGPSNGLPGKGKGLALKLKDPNPQPNAQTTLSFRYTAPDGGYFERQMVFKLAGKPEIIIKKELNLLSTEQYFDLPFTLSGCGENPQFVFSCTSGLVTADLSVGCDEKERFLRLSPGEEDIDEDLTVFTRPAKCTFEIQYGEKPEDKISAELEVTLCYEGIGTAFLKTPVNKAPGEIIIPCDASKGERERKAFVLPLTVMIWDSGKRLLGPDTAAAKALSMEVNVRANQRMPIGSEIYNKLKTMVDNAKIALCDTKNTVEIEQKLSPAIFGLQATDKEADSDIEVMLTFASDLPQIATLTLDARTFNNMDFKAMIRWLIGYPAGSYASQFIELGDVNLYYNALDHIVGVYDYKRTPSAVKGFIGHRSTENYYEHGEGNVKDAYIALHVMPTGIGDMKGVTLLFHELTHVLEDIILDERDGEESMGCERNAYLMDGLAPAVHYLCNAEKAGSDAYDNISKAIKSLSDAVNHKNVKPWLPETMSATLKSFGARYTTLPKELFYHYATAYSGANAEEIRNATRRTFCPAGIHGLYYVKDGLFKGGEWVFRWAAGNLSRVGFTCPGYTFEDFSYEWVPDSDKLILKAFMTIQKNGTSYKEYVDVTLEGSISYKFGETAYVEMPEIHITWELGIPPGKKFYDPPTDSPFFAMRKQSNYMRR